MAEPSRRWIRPVVLSVLAGLLAGAVPFVAGVDLGHTATLALGAAATTLAVQALPAVPPVGWPAPPEHDEGTGWHQVRLLSQALGQLDEEPDRVGTVLLPRLRALAGARLRAAGVDPTSARARELLGPGLYDALGGTAALLGRRRGTPATDLVRTLLDRLDELDAPQPRPMEHHRDLTSP